MATANSASRRPWQLLPQIAIALAIAFLVLIGNTPQPAWAGSLSISNSGTTATIAAPTSIKYKLTEMENALWNHGTFYVYFFEGASGVESEFVKASGSDIPTRKTTLNFTDGVSWAKVHVAAASSSSPENGGKNKRLKSSSGANLKYWDYLLKGQEFYVWISDTGGSGGTISLRGTETTTIYADGKTFKNVEAIKVTSQPAMDHYSQGAEESDFNCVINVPFRWSGKDASQVPFKAFSNRGVGNSPDYVTFYRMAWRQYANGTTYSGYSPYKLQHGLTNATNIWTSINLAAIGLATALTFTDETYQKKAPYVFRNYDTALICCLKKPKEQIKLDTSGGTLTKGSSSYSGSSENYKKAFCETKVTLPKEGYKIGKDGTKKGYKLTGYQWKSGTKRSSYESSSPNTTKKFVSFDQASPKAPSSDSPEVKVCNNWQMPEFAPDNLASDTGDLLSAPSVANVTFKAMWEALPFEIHYIVNGEESETVQLSYDETYQLKAAPSGSNGWTVQKADGTPGESKGFMPSQDLYAYAETPDASTVRYFVDGKLMASYSIPFGTTPLTTTYVDKSSGGIEYNDDGRWDVANGSFSATYKEHYNIPDHIACSHWKDTSYYVPGYWVSSGYWISDTKGGLHYIDCSYYISGYTVTQGEWMHAYDEQDNYSYYNTISYSSEYGAPPNPNGGIWHGWYTNPDCTAKASSSYSFSQGDCLSFYSYTTHKVSYSINGKTVLEEEKRYGTTVNPYSHGDDLNEYGGELRCWFKDPACTDKTSTRELVGSEDLAFYAYTEHTIHFWMDAGKKVALADSDSSGADDDEGQDDGATDSGPEELAYCRHELHVRYGDTVTLPTGNAVSEKVTRPGCEDWATNNGVWFTDEACTKKASSGICTGDATYFSFNLAKLTYALSTYAEELERSQELFAQKSNAPVTLASFLPAPQIYRYGTSVSIAGDGQVWWKSSGGLPRSAVSVKGGFMAKDATGSAVKTVVLQRSITVYKDWAQGLFDGIITK